MDITQKDRDSLRTKQQLLAPSFTIGNIIEHKIQDPAKYKKLSRQEQGLTPDAQPQLPKIKYDSKYFNQKNSDSDTVMVDKSEPDMDSEEVDSSSASAIESDIPVSSEIQFNLWLNMDRLEIDKLEWMSEKAERAFREKLKSSTHFDRHGRAIPPTYPTKIDKDNQAHDIDALIKLLDSTFQPQITYSLRVISKIADQATSGLYDAVFDENIHQVLIRECLLRVRRHIDSSNETICINALRCLRSLICNTHVDETFLDKISSLYLDDMDIVMWLNKEQDDFDIELNDQDCVLVDAILALLARSNLLQRLAYLLQAKVRSDFRRAYQDCILDLLIRIARHSKEACWMIGSYDIPKLLMTEFLPSDITNQNKEAQFLALRSLKLFRILANAALELNTLDHDNESLKLKLPEAIERTIIDYYHIDCYNYPSEIFGLTFRIHIETLRLMRQLMRLPKFPKYMFNVITMNLDFLIKNLKVLTKLIATTDVGSPSSLDWQYAASLIDLVATMVQYEKNQLESNLMVSNWMSFVFPSVMQWWADLIREQLIPHQDVSIAIASALQHIENCSEKKSGRNWNVAPDNREDFFSLIMKDMYQLTASYYRKLMKEADLNSCLGGIFTTDGRLRDPAMLPSYGFLNYNNVKDFEFSINKIAGFKTPFILLNAFTDLLRQNKPLCKELFKDQENSRNLSLYLMDTSRYFKNPSGYESSVQRCFLAQLEVRILAKSLTTMIDYFLNPDLSDLECGNKNNGNSETQKLAESRVECYSNLILEAVSIIGLINPDSEQLSSLRDGLIEKVFLDGEVHSRLSRESYVRISDIGMQVSFRGTDERLVTCLRNCHLEDDDLLILKPIYMNCAQYNRFWLFQPIIQYYKSQLSNGETCSESKGKWFVENMAYSSTDGLKTKSSDSNVIGAILRLNATLMECSIAYLNIAIRPKIEQLVCLIATVFLDTHLFQDPTVSSALRKNFEVIFSRCLEKTPLFADASRKLETLDLTLADFFSKLVEHYEASSYGDINFSNFLLLFISPNSDRVFRRTLFSEKLETCLSQMRLPLESVWIPLSYMNGSKYQDPEIRSLIKLAGPYLAQTDFLRAYRRNCMASWDAETQSDDK